MGEASTLFVEILHISNNALRYFAEPLNPRGIMVQLEIEASDYHTIFMTLLRLDANIAMMPHAAPSFCRNSNQILRPKPINRPPGGCEAQTTKHAWRSVSSTPPLSRHMSLPSSTTRSPSPPAPPLDLVNHHLDLVNKVNSSSCALAFYVPNC